MDIPLARQMGITNLLELFTMKKLILSAAILGTSLIASSAFAQNYYYPSSNSNSYGYQGAHNNNYQVLGQNVNQLHQNGRYMTNNYAVEQRNYNGCSNSAALLAEMRRYNSYTTQLVSSYNGTCPVTFKSNVAKVNTSWGRINSLRRNARVSPTVSAYITRTSPSIRYVNTNYSYFQPRTAVKHQSRGYNHSRGYGHGKGHGRNYSHSSSRHHDKGIDLKSALIGAVAGRILHEVTRH